MNTYKTLTIILSVLLIIAIAVIIWPSNGDKPVDRLTTEPPPTPQQLKLLDFLLADDILMKKWSDSSAITPNTGVFLPTDLARQNLRDFKDIINVPDTLISPYAFAFGRNKVKQLLEHIDRQNVILQSTTSEDSIQGVRIYLTLSRKDTKPHLDLVFVPVLGSGRDYYQLNKSIVDDPGFLNTSSPCPEICN